MWYIIYNLCDYAYVYLKQSGLTYHYWLNSDIIVKLINNICTFGLILTLSGISKSEQLHSNMSMCGFDPKTTQLELVSINYLSSLKGVWQLNLNMTSSPRKNKFFSNSALFGIRIYLLLESILIYYTHMNELPHLIL